MLRVVHSLKSYWRRQTLASLFTKIGLALDPDEGSMHPNDGSVLRTRRVQLAVYWLMLAVGSHMPQLTFGEDTNEISVFQIDKTLHVLAFAGLVFLLFRACLAGRCASVLANALVATCISCCYAVIDEYSQRWVERDVSISDVVAGLIGIFSVFLLITAPPKRLRASRGTLVMRVVVAASFVLILVVALAPDGDTWVNRFARFFFRPWPGMDKPGHFYTAAALTLLLVQASPAGVQRPRLGILVTILVMGLMGPIIETAQSYTGRSVEMADLYAHQVGLLAAMLGLSVLAVGRALRTRCRSRSIQDG
jgi:VanZ family protein